MDWSCFNDLTTTMLFFFPRRPGLFCQTNMGRCSKHGCSDLFLAAVQVFWKVAHAWVIPINSEIFLSHALFIELDYGKIYRKPLYLMVKTMVSCKFSLKPIQWTMKLFTHQWPLEALGGASIEQGWRCDVMIWRKHGGDTQRHKTTSRDMLCILTGLVLLVQTLGDLNI